MSAQWSPRRLTPGMPITVVLGRHFDHTVAFQRTRVVQRKRGRRSCSVWLAQQHGWDDFVLRLEEEGIKWCRGHEGQAVDALKVAAAL